MKKKTKKRETLAAERLAQARQKWIDEFTEEAWEDYQAAAAAAGVVVMQAEEVA